MSAPDLGAAARLLDEAVAGGVVPGAVALVDSGGQTVFDYASGHAQTAPAVRPVQPDTIYDLASLTKAIVTATAIMILVDRGDIHLRQQVVEVAKDAEAGEVQRIGLSQEQRADMMGVTRETLRRWDSKEDRLHATNVAGSPTHIKKSDGKVQPVHPKQRRWRLSH